MKRLLAIFFCCLIVCPIFGESAQKLFERSAQTVDGEIALAKTELLAKEKIFELSSRLEALNVQIAALRNLLSAKNAENDRAKESAQILRAKIGSGKSWLRALTVAVEKIFAECAEYVKTLPYPLNDIYSAEADKAAVVPDGVSAISRKAAFLKTLCDASKEYSLYDYPLNGKDAKFLTFGLNSSFYRILSTGECGKMNGNTPVEIKDANLKKLFDMAQNAEKITPVYLEQTK